MKLSTKKCNRGVEVISLAEIVGLMEKHRYKLADGESIVEIKSTEYGVAVSIHNEKGELCRK